MNKKKISTIQEKLERTLHTKQVEIIDESNLHIGHTAYTQNKIYLALSIYSDQFSGLTLIARQRMIYHILKEEMLHDIHALRFIKLSDHTIKEK